MCSKHSILGSFPLGGDRIPKISNLKREKFNLAHGFCGFSLWLVSLKAENQGRVCDRTKLLSS